MGFSPELLQLASSATIVARQPDRFSDVSSSMESALESDTADESAETDGEDLAMKLAKMSASQKSVTIGLLT